jgi:hypothetical protein
VLRPSFANKERSEGGDVGRKKEGFWSRRLIYFSVSFLEGCLVLLSRDAIVATDNRKAVVGASEAE